MSQEYTEVPGKQQTDLSNLFGVNVYQTGNFVIYVILLVGAITFFTILVIAGYRLLTSQDNNELSDRSYNQVTAALTGLVIIFVGWSIISLVEIFWGITITQSIYTMLNS